MSLMFFFFKQKTAYEMRISDWSSDVCSSDLKGQPTEQPRQHTHRQEEAGPAGDPACPVERRTAARHDAMNVRVMMQVLAPRMEHGDEADLGAEMLRVGRDPAQRLGRRPEQDGVDGDRKSTRLNSSHSCASRMPSSA